jgi:carbon storage regulator
MLVLTRSSGQSIRIGEEIVVKVVDVQEDKTRLGVEAPREIKVQRFELASGACCSLSNRSPAALTSPRTRARTVATTVRYHAAHPSNLSAWAARNHSLALTHARACAGPYRVVRFSRIRCSRRPGNHSENGGVKR